ncbi:hypothetical protein E2C01_010533 [Portunus trituberculatus]|uniref:Uncharacterized protein n=1 Tax=Portunus trituberculatus TaxID=210409 RepID=A0A5B7D8P8_PORTR|nr:hypothetical protein [Portunus trituberculatus]
MVLQRISSDRPSKYPWKSLYEPLKVHEPQVENSSTTVFEALVSRQRRGRPGEGLFFSALRLGLATRILLWNSVVFYEGKLPDTAAECKFLLDSCLLVTTTLMRCVASIVFSAVLNDIV